MKRLILTTDQSGAGCLVQAGFANCVVPIGPRFVWGPLPEEAELATLLARRGPTLQTHWLDSAGERLAAERAEGAGLTEFCARFDAVELWIDPDPNAQLILIWLLDHLRGHPEITAKLTLVQADAAIGNCTLDEVAGRRSTPVQIQSGHLEIASTAWRAFRAPTPQDWFGLLGQDLGALPQVKRSVLDLLDELPAVDTGLGATEMRMLDLISAGHASPFDVFPGEDKPNQRRVFGYWEVGVLLDRLAHCPHPLVSGFGDGPFTLEMHDDRDRLARYRESRLALTTLGKAVLAGADDFSRHNPVHRWWGGTELTRDRLWRWDAASGALIAP